MNNQYKKNRLFLIPVITLLIFISMTIEGIGQDTDENTELLNEQYEYYSNLLTELEVLAQEALKDLSGIQENIEKRTDTLNEQSQQLAIQLMELEVLIKSNTENSQSLSDVVSSNIDKLQEETEYYITLLKELEALSNSMNKELDTEFIYEYDDENRLKTIKSKLTNKTIYEFKYDDNGNLLEVIKK